MPRTSMTLALICGFAWSGHAAMPEGAGLDLVEGVCTGCHQTNQIERSSGYTADQWRELTAAFQPFMVPFWPFHLQSG